MVAHLAGELAQCPYCKCDHTLFLCKTFQLLTANERLKFVSSKHLCTICLRGHSGRCRYHFRCAECKKAHNTLLHCNIAPVAAVNPATSTMASASPAALTTGKSYNSNDVLLPTAKVKVIARDGSELHLKALLDSGFQMSFVSAKVVKLLGMMPTQTDTNIIGITNTKSNVKYCLPLEVHSLASPFKTTITCHVVEQITCKLPQNKLNLSNFKLPPNVMLADD